VFVSVFLGGPSSSFEIYVMNSDGSGRRRLTNNLAADNFPTWSPDGRKILFESRRDGNREIYVMRADGSNQTRLTDYSGVDFTARYHPEGHRIAFDRAPGDGNAGPFAVYTMRPDGTRIRKLSEDTLQAGAPDWSPGGDRLVFQNNNCFTCPSSDLFAMNPAGRHVRQLTNDFGNNLWGHFSPGGRRIAFTHEDPPIDFTHEEIYTMNADGSGRVNITNTPTVDEFGADW
jgi:TolB protein